MARAGVMYCLDWKPVIQQELLPQLPSRKICYIWSWWRDDGRITRCTPGRYDRLWIRDESRIMSYDINGKYEIAENAVVT